jgi:hypothetical protein
MGGGTVTNANAGRTPLIITLGLVFVILMMAGGCATNQSVELTYEIAPSETPAPAHSSTIYVAPFEDRRSEPETVGEIERGLWGSVVRPDTQIRLEEGTVGDWIRNALKAELELHGYDVVGVDGRSDWQVFGTVLELSYSEGGWPIMTNPSAVLTIECRVVHDGKAIVKEAYWNSVRASSRPGDPARLLETALRRDLKRFIEDLETERKRVGGEG